MSDTTATATDRAREILSWPSPSLSEFRASADQGRVDKWIRDRLVDWRDSCLRCRKRVAPGQHWTTVSNGEVTARFHQDCHAEWRVQQETLARKALCLPEKTS